MGKLLKMNGVYGVQVGHRFVFTKEAALERYKLFLEYVYKDCGLDVTGSLVLSEVQEDLIKIGFTYEELEKIEIEYVMEI